LQTLENNMAGNWLRRSLLLAAGAAALGLAGCGSGDIASEFVPARVIAFGDSFAEMGQSGTRYTVNDGTSNIWTQQVALAYGRTLATARSGGFSYATANARIATKPDAVGNAATPTVEDQISTFLAGNSLSASGDLVLLSAGTADIVAEVAKVNAGTQTGEAAIANVRAAGRAYAAQVRRLVAAGAQHVAVAGVYDLGKSPWALQTGQATLLNQAASRFNEDLLVSLVDMGASVLYIDTALHFNLEIASPSGYGLNNATDLACASVDPGVGIGTGTGQVSSGLCTPSTIVPGRDYNVTLFADRLYPTAIGHRLFGDYAYSRLRQRW
jgi:phospholipase/lecithinase/hemolysin